MLHAQSKRRRPNKTKDDDVPLPDPFPIPKHFCTNVEEALKSGKIATKERRMFLSDIASAMLRYKRYPTKEDYINVGRAVIQAYPFLQFNYRPAICKFYNSGISIIIALITIFMSDNRMQLSKV